MSEEIFKIIHAKTTKFLEQFQEDKTFDELNSATVLSSHIAIVLTCLISSFPKDESKATMVEELFKNIMTQTNFLLKTQSNKEETIQ